MLGESRRLKWFELAAGQAEKADEGPAVTGRAADKPGSTGSPAQNMVWGQPRILPGFHPFILTQKLF